MTQSIFSCDGDVRVDHPISEDYQMWALWAAQDCSNYDMIITVLFDDYTYVNARGYVGADLSKRRCGRADYLGDGMNVCEFEMPAGSDNFGILFSGGFQPIYYVVDWRVSMNRSPSFDYWQW